MGTVTISHGLRANRDSPQCAGLGDGPILPELGTVAISSGWRANGDCPHFRGPATLADRAQWGQSRLAMDCALIVTVPNAPDLATVPIVPELGTVAISSGWRANGDCPHLRGPATLADRAQWGQSRLAMDCALIVTVPNAPDLATVPSCRNWDCRH